MRLARCGMVFSPADPPRLGTVDLIEPPGLDGPSSPNVPAGDALSAAGEVPGSGAGTAPGLAGLPGARRGELTVTEPGPDGIGVRRVPVVRLPLVTALPLLAGLRRDEDTHPAIAFWSVAALTALHLVARGRVLPGVSPAGFDAWRIGPLDVADVRRIAALAAAMPPQARAVPLVPEGARGSDGAEAVPVDPDAAPRLPDATGLVRAFLDAVADLAPRTEAAPALAGSPLYTAAEPQQAGELADWAAEVSAGVDSGLRVSLRLEVRGEFGSAPFTAVVGMRKLTDPTQVIDAAELWGDGDHDFGDRATLEAMLAVRRAAQVWPRLERLLDETVPAEVELLDEDVEDLLAGARYQLAAAGVVVTWPDGLSGDLRARAVVGAEGPRPADVAGHFRAAQAFPVVWQLVAAGEPLTDAETDHVAKAGPVVWLRDRWWLVEPELARRARDRELPALTGYPALTAVLAGSIDLDGEQVEVVAGGWLAEVGSAIADPDGGPGELRAPPELAATLRDYQLRGLRWLHRMTALGFGGCLADDMGLGKTITLIALHLRRAKDPATAGPTLVVCPASLLGNWEREIHRFASGVAVVRFHGSSRDLTGVRSGFVLTTYGTMRVDAEVLAGRPWGMVVADEAQHVKNGLSGTAKALRLIGAGAKVALTGTPVENNLTELWTVLDWTSTGLLGPLGRFRTDWARPVEVERDTATAGRLSRVVRPFLLRRRKTDPGIAPELPPKTETDHPVALTREQAVLYRSVVREVMAEIRGSTTDIARRGLVLKLLVGLKQVCNHPAHYSKERLSGLAGRSGKLELLDELLGTILAEDGAVLVFTQYVEMARLLEKDLTARGVPSQLLHGGTPVAERDRMVARFQDGAVPVFLLSLKAAGTGLNLTRADHVIHYDRWWNPAVEAQATDRAHRIGQTRPLQVHRLIAEGTLEERIADLLDAKRELADAVFSGGEGALANLSDGELLRLVDLRSA